ncbi:MAG: glycosyltransferase family 39 protein [Opitutales bacterium]|nr:glycosyltransferase family 39 protein [Opitutales bacterium]
MLKITIAILSGLLVLMFPFLILDGAKILWLARYTSYWWMVVILLCFCYYAWKNFSRISSLKKMLIDHKAGLIGVLLVSLFSHIHEEKEFKILFDEYVLSLTAKDFFAHQEAFSTNNQHHFHQTQTRVDGIVDKRPVFFPFLVSLIHSVSGFRVSNGFVANLLLTPIFLLLLYGVTTCLTHRSFGLLSLCLVATSPLFFENANGAGFEILNMTLILGLMLSCVSYLKSPDKPRLGLMLSIGLLLANTRYESILYLIVVVVVFGVRSIRDRKLELSNFASISPIFVFPALLSNRVFASNSAFFAKGDHNHFGLEHLVVNMKGALLYLFDFEGDYSNSLVISILGLVAMLFLFLYFLKNFRTLFFRPCEISVFFCFLLVVVGVTGLLQFYFWGNWTDPVTTRFSLPLQIFMIITVSVVLSKGFEFSRFKNIWLIPFVVFSLSVSASVSYSSSFKTSNFSKVAYDWCIEYAEQNLDKDKVLVISDGSTGFILYDFASVSTDVFKLIPERIMRLKELGVYDELYITRMIRRNPFKGDVTDLSLTNASERLVLEPVAEIKIKLNYYFTIERIVSLSPPTDEGNRTLEANMPPPLPKEGSLDERELTNYIYELCKVSEYPLDSTNQLTEG